MLFPSQRTAERCREFILRKRIQQPNGLSSASEPRTLDLVIEDDPDVVGKPAVTAICAVILPVSDWQNAKRFWQHTGEGVSSRRAEIFRKAFDDDHLQPRAGIVRSERIISPAKGPRRYQRQDSAASKGSTGQTPDVFDTVQFLEERYGRNLDMSLSRSAKLAIRKRIAGSNDADKRQPKTADGLGSLQSTRERDTHTTVDDVYLYPCGMNAIFNTHQILLRARGHLKSIMFGLV